MGIYHLVLKLRQHPRATYAGVFGVFFVALLLAFSIIGAIAVQRDLEQRLDAELRETSISVNGIQNTLATLQAKPNFPPCSEAFLKWMDRVAFLPDGVHEIAYAENGQILCSVTSRKLNKPIALGTPDYSPHDNSSIWLDRDLGMLGFPGLKGTFINQGNFVIVAPELSLAVPLPAHISYEIVSLSPDGKVWHRKGVRGLYAAISGRPAIQPMHVSPPFGFSGYGCEPTNNICVVFAEPLAPLLKTSGPALLAGIALALLLAGILLQLVRRILEKEWSLPTRVRRRLSMETVVCHYQPLLDVHTDKITAIEVLARWRDDDGTLVSPDQFLPIVEKRGMHRALTKFVVDRAYQELSTLADMQGPLRVHFNIFPCEFAPGRMLALFEDFLADSSRFTVVLELVENDILPVDRTRSTIAQLREQGILTFIDDFGEGYSSIGYLAGLGTYGVKIDRSFGLAPEGSLMDAMLTSAIDMVSKTGQTIVVEGVETPWRLTTLKANPKVAVAQGYYISRPIDIQALKAILANDGSRNATEAA